MPGVALEALLGGQSLSVLLFIIPSVPSCDVLAANLYLSLYEVLRVVLFWVWKRPLVRNHLPPSKTLVEASWFLFLAFLRRVGLPHPCVPLKSFFFSRQGFYV